MVDKAEGLGRALGQAEAAGRRQHRTARHLQHTNIVTLVGGTAGDHWLGSGVVLLCWTGGAPDVSSGGVTGAGAAGLTACKA